MGNRHASSKLEAKRAAGRSTPRDKVSGWTTVEDDMRFALGLDAMLITGVPERMTLFTTRGITYVRVKMHTVADMPVPVMRLKLMRP